MISCEFKMKILNSHLRDFLWIPHSRFEEFGTAIAAFLPKEFEENHARTRRVVKAIPKHHAAPHWRPRFETVLQWTKLWLFYTHNINENPCFQTVINFGLLRNKHANLNRNFILIQVFETMKTKTSVTRKIHTEETYILNDLPYKRIALLQCLQNVSCVRNRDFGGRQKLRGDSRSEGDYRKGDETPFAIRSWDWKM